jgi:hypothetical protein
VALGSGILRSLSRVPGLQCLLYLAASGGMASIERQFSRKPPMAAQGGGKPLLFIRCNLAL